MRILSYNIHGWDTIDYQSNVAMIAEVLKKANADIIGLNEVNHPAQVSEGIALEWLAEQLQMAHVFMSCEPWPFKECLQSAGYGNALLSRYPILSASTFRFTPVSDEQRRGCLLAKLDLGEDNPFQVVLTHLDHTNEKLRSSQVSNLLDFISPGKTQEIDLIMGDFNCIHPRDYEHRPEAMQELSKHPLAGHMVHLPDGPIVTQQMENGGFVDAFVQKEIFGVNTFIPASDSVRLDYIWLSKTSVTRLNQVGIIDEATGKEASDHRPVYVDLKGS